VWGSGLPFGNGSGGRQSEEFWRPDAGHRGTESGPAARERWPLARIENRREVFGWAMFDFANSSFTTVIVTTLFAVYFKEHLTAGRDDGHFLWGLAIAVSQMLVVISAPIVGALADFSGAKKRLLFASYVICVVMTFFLGLTPPGAVVAAMALFVLANFGFSSGESLVAGFLPEIAAPENVGKVSGLGWSIGYFGGILSIILAKTLSSGLEPVDANRVVCWTTSGFFLLAGIPTFLWVRERKAREAMPAGESYVTIGFRRLGTTWRHLRDFRQLLRFLLVFLVFSSGVATVVAFSFIYAKGSFGFGDGEVVVLFVVINVAAAAGAFAFGILQDRLGSRLVLQIVLGLWTIVVATAALAKSQAVFWVAGLGVGLGIGSTQSASRALVALFSPRDRTGEFLGFWGSTQKLAAVLGTLTFGILADVIDPRTAVALTASWFLAGFAGMFLVDERKGRAEAEAADAAGGYLGDGPVSSA
jgi:UMF1 family MFS transporter